MASIESHSKSFASWREANGKTRLDLELSALGMLREAYPNHHVTRTLASKCDLLGYAKAGFAVATPDNLSEYDATRIYKAPGPRLEKKAGEIVNNSKFFRYKYEWQEHQLVVYDVSYVDRYLRNIKLLFVIVPLSSEEMTQMHHPTTDALLLAAGEWTRELHEEVYVFDNAEWKKDKDLFKSVKGSSWDDVILDPAMKAALVRDVEGFFDNEAIYKSLRAPWKRGVILHGVPGNGKTISIKALIESLARRETPVPSLYVKAFDACQGPKWSIQQIFKHARLMAPCLLIFEDLDSMVEEKVRSYFLNEVDGLESNDGILMIGSTNHLNRLDPAIAKRPSRFDRKYHFKVPGEKERAAYAQYWRSKLVDSEAIDFPEDLCPIIAKITEDFSFAYLKELFVTALLTLVRGELNGPDEDTEAWQESPSASETASTSDGVVVERESEDEEKATEKKESGSDEKAKDEKTAPPKPKKTMPEFEVPNHLQGNKLLKIITAQAQVLIDEMDNSQKEETPKLGGVCAPTPFRFPIPDDE
ncbi:putative proteasome-activating nucleotidase protein [Phaeoacremonium minimum UCRPA7]|uniref:Putative proteasome-activating nucleotidase protein n=1 Tax=Phaeoacremonium minimum (strain UCR-PA7) TaxID=1286976 RepID=R8BSJ7_PHAM7|nr:putative proteasome-activating nucleotidase protein [Phaeoacremonium minimum UCRPA7]EOO02299.1 putative proteasome-activating nucleotidase protein [Phaeoacremonium minimum UCRPA7]